MYLSEEQYQQIAKTLPRQHGNIGIENRVLLDGLIFRCKTGCAWRGLPKSLGKSHTIYTRLNRWRKSSVLERVYTALAAEGVARILAGLNCGQGAHRRPRRAKKTTDKR